MNKIGTTLPFKQCLLGNSESKTGCHLGLVRKIVVDGKLLNVIP
jgi:hypothetical protein